MCNYSTVFSHVGIILVIIPMKGPQVKINLYLGFSNCFLIGCFFQMSSDDRAFVVDVAWLLQIKRSTFASYYPLGRHCAFKQQGC